jgi:hypothetical protein
LVFGPLGGFVPWPVKIRATVLPPVELEVTPGLDRYDRRAIADWADRVRGRLQHELDHRVRSPRATTVA